jgi:choline kinase
MSRQRSRQISIQDERVLPVESWGDLQKYFITNHQERLKGVKKYEKEFLARYKKRQKTWSKKKVSIPLRQIEDLGRFSFREHVIVKREEYLAERKDYEQKYLHRCVKTRNSKPMRSSSKKLDLDLISGRLNLREHVEEKRKELQAERGEYEKKYVSRYKESEIKLKKSKPSREYNEDLGRLNFREHVVTKREKLQAERDEYERKYVSKFKKLQKTKLKITALEQKLRLSQIELEEPKPSIKQKRREYEKEYIIRYSKQQKAKPKKKVFAIR